MTPDNLRALSAGGEGQYIEFKKNINHPNQIIEEVVGFANSKGGSLLIGIDDSGELTGLKFAEDDASFIIDYINNNITPEPLFEFEIINLSKKRAVLHFKIKEGNKKPYGIIKHDSKSTKAFYRVGDKCLQISREMKNILKGSSFNKGQVIKYTDLEDEVMKLVEREQPITKEFVKQNSSFTSRKISDCLVRLVLAGVLKITPAAEGDLYEFNHQN